MLILVGLNHRSAPVEIRERISFSSEELPEALAGLLAIDGIAESMILSTCNRVELLVRSDDGLQPALQKAKSFLAGRSRLSPDDLDRYTYQLSADKAVRHLFSVASGLDSMILGEPQILGQVKMAYKMAKECDATGPVLDHLLQQCLATAKRVRTETGISRHAVSVAYAAVELARRIFGKLNGRSALLLGAGKMSDLVAKHLLANGVAELSVASRTYNSAVAAAARVGGKAINWDHGMAQLAGVDIVVSCTGATQPILSKQDVAAAMRARRSGPLFLIDIAVPRDIDPAANELDNVYLYDIDGLEGVVEVNLGERKQAAERGGMMIDDEAELFERWRRSRQMAPVIVTLRERLLGIGEDEVDRFKRKLGPLQPYQERAVDELISAVVRKILHRPVRHLRDSVERGDTAECTSLYCRIFGIKSDSPEARGCAACDPQKPCSDRPDDPQAGPSRLLKGGKKD
jgi:glutamyl-tRNA reductase